MIEKRLLHAMLSRLRVGGLKVTYWDGETSDYGPDPAGLHLTLRHPKVVRAMIRNTTLGFGEAYMNDDIRIEGDIRLLGKLMSANKSVLAGLPRNRWTRRLNTNKVGKQARHIQHHYDLGNDFYKLWLDNSMTYSCAYFQTQKSTLEEAQAAKVDHILRKLQLEKGMTLLDIGSGWGQLLIRAAQEYGVVGHGITLSREQLKHCQAEAKRLGLEKQLTFELRPYDDLARSGRVFDRIVSVGMYEHVGRGNHESYFEAVDKMLIPGGLSVLHTITNEVETSSDPWIDKYIFPGGYIPSIRETAAHLPDHNFRLIDYENLRIHYAMTCEEWLRRFETHKDTVIKMYDERFYRMWRLYLAGSSSGFRYGDLSLSQFVFTKGTRNDLPLTRDFLYRS